MSLIDWELEEILEENRKQAERMQKKIRRRRMILTVLFSILIILTAANAWILTIR